MSEAPKFRPDIEGLRAVAVLLVLAFHAGLPVRGGYAGVDVFFVISGFLITGLLLREAESKGRISLVDFYARRSKRLLPAASVVLLVTVGLSRWVAPALDRPVFALDAVAAAAYFVNWRFAERSVDYLAEDVGRSPALHFWSLSVEEQFYLIWPLLIIGATALARRTKRSPRITTAVALSVVLVPSFAWSVSFTRQSAGEAFFVTTTRLWELSIGALLLLSLPSIQRIPKRLAAPVGWLGAVLIAGSAVLFNNETAWPGFWAAFPTVGTALLILAGSTEAETRLGHLLAARPMVWVGRRSYSIYLWHWPLVVVGQDWLKLEGIPWGSTLVLASLIPAWLSYRFLERPLHYSVVLAQHPLATLSLGANLSLVAVVAGLVSSREPGAIAGAGGTLEVKVLRGKVVVKPKNLGAGALGNRPQSSPAGKVRNSYSNIVPPPNGAKNDIPRAYALGCQATFPDETPKWCEIGDVKAKRRAVVLGDSMVLQYFEALDAAGKALGWRMSTATKSSCASSDAIVTREGIPYEACTRFNEEVMRQLEADPPLVVITAQDTSTGYMPGQKPVRTRDGMVNGLVSRWARLQRLGTKVVVVLDNPHPKRGNHVYKCMMKHPKQASRCAFDRKQGVGDSGAVAQKKAAGKLSGVHVIDLTRYVCPRSKCAPVIGGVLVYRHGAHVTNTYVKTLTPLLTDRLRQALQGVDE